MTATTALRGQYDWPTEQDYGDAHYRLDFYGPDDGYTREQDTADEVTVAAYHRRNRAAHAPQNGCSECGMDRHGHGQRWHEGLGFGGWVEPTDALRKARTIARRMVAAETARYRADQAAWRAEVASWAQAERDAPTMPVEDIRAGDRVLNHGEWMEVLDVDRDRPASPGGAWIRLATVSIGFPAGHLVPTRRTPEVTP